MKKIINSACILLLTVMFSPALAQDGSSDRLNRQDNRMDERLGRYGDRTDGLVARNSFRGDRRFDAGRDRRGFRGSDRYWNRRGHGDYRMHQWQKNRYRKHLYFRPNDRNYNRNYGHMYSPWYNRHHRDSYSHRPTNRYYRHYKNW